MMVNFAVRLPRIRIDFPSHYMIPLNKKVWSTAGLSNSMSHVSHWWSIRGQVLVSSVSSAAAACSEDCTALQWVTKKQILTLLFVSFDTSFSFHLVRVRMLVDYCRNFSGPQRTFDIVNVSGRGKSIVAESPQFFDAQEESIVIKWVWNFWSRKNDVVIWKLVLSPCEAN